MKEIKARIERWWKANAESYLDRPWGDRSWAEKITGGVAALAFLTTREILRDRGPMMAASLAFFTVLAMVPLVTVAASLMAAFGLLESDGGAVFDALYQIFPDVASGLAHYLSDVATQSAQAVGGIGGVTLLIIGLVLFNAIEETLTKIWRGAHDRPVIIKMMTFYAMITFGPILIALSIVQTAGAQIYLTEMGLSATLLDRSLPLFYALIAFTLLNKIVPSADVKWRSAIVGGLFTAIVFELAKWGFNVYVNQLLLHTYDRVYGTLALIPIGLIWVYITWFVILIGAELSYSFQYLRELLKIEAGRRSSESRPGGHRAIHPVVALEVLAPVLRSFESGDGAISEKEIARSTELPAHILSDVLDRWIQIGVIVEVESVAVQRTFLPASPAETFTLAEIVEPFWVRRQRRMDGGVDEMSEAYLAVSREFFQGRTGADLIGIGVDYSKAVEEDQVGEETEEEVQMSESEEKEQEKEKPPEEEASEAVVS